MASPPPSRWRPGRAGILNVYQYEDETLHFADGRLLLRGVNGSGKSTAMNMLLPFLLEADTRRIDAAGEQTGVLTSWMLADNEETQRTGYLWLEFQRPDGEVPGGVAFRTVGCGIRANRSTSRTTPWWFSTPLRPRIDFALTAHKVPLAVDALRAELGTEAVFTSVSEYRAEVARRLFGGADPAGYLRLLHQVRNPRVGDRIDADLPRRLQEALPPVAEDAVADAAQPLEDLEEHRRNVVALESTDRALGTVLDTYRNYARRVLRAAADQTAESVTTARSSAQARGRLRTAAEEAETRRKLLEEHVEDLDRKHRTVGAELDGVLRSPAYQQAAALAAKREHVENVERQARQAEITLTLAERRVGSALHAVQKTRARTEGDLAALSTDLTTAAEHGRRAGTELPLPASPALRTQPLGSVDGPETGDDPFEGLSVAPAADAVRARRRHLDDVRTQVGRAGTARAEAEKAEGAAGAADTAAGTARAAAATARTAADDAAASHREALATWAQEWSAHVAAVPAAAPGEPPGWLAAPAIVEPEPTTRRATAAARVGLARAAAATAVEAVEPVIASATLRTRLATEQVERTSAELERVLAATELPLPRPAWQEPDPPDAELFAALVDFEPGLDDSARAGLEAACESAGLLTATVGGDGVVVSAAGELLLVADEPVTQNLGTVLVPVPAPGTDVRAVARVLAAVGLGAGSGAPLWVSPDGRFGAGSLRGRHHKETAEHLGTGAREAARRRRIVELEAMLASEERERAAEDDIRAALVAWRATISDLVAAVPPTQPVDDADVEATGAMRDARRAAEAAAEARSEAVAAEQVAEREWALAESHAAEHGLPVDTGGLDAVGRELDDAAVLLRGLPDRMVTARRSWADWLDAVDRYQDEALTQVEQAEAAERARIAANSARTELTAVEAALGDTPQRVAAQVADLKNRHNGLAEDLAARRKDHTDAVAAASTARATLVGADAEVRRAEATCDVQRAALRAVLAVNGLLTAAVDDPGSALSVTAPDTVDGTARLVMAVRELVPAPARPIDEDALGRSLRQIRDALGAGWDAEARRAGDGAPVAVEVSGPYGRRALPDAAVQVTVDLRRARGLLTAQQDQALRNLLHGRVAREVARTLFDAGELVRTMNGILSGVTTTQGIGVRLDWRTRGDLDQATATALKLLAKDPDARTETEDAAVRAAVAGLVEEARAADPEASYRDVIAGVLDYRNWHELKIYLRRPGRPDELLRRRTTLSEGEKKLVTYLPMAAAASASAAAHDPHQVGAPRLILLDDAFAKVSEDNHERLFGLLIDLDLDFVVTSERLFGTHASVPALSIVEVLRDPDLRTIALVHYHWDGRRRTERASA